MSHLPAGYLAYLDDGQGLVNGGLGVEGQLGVDLGGDLAGDDLENLLAELNKETVEGGIDLLVDGLAVGLAVGNSSIDESGVLGLLGGSQDQGGVGGGILGLVLADSCVLLAIAHNCRPRKRGRRGSGRARGIDD